MRRRRSLLCFAFVLAACEDSGPSRPELQGGRDAGLDLAIAAPDAAPDAAVDAAPDAAPDAIPEAAVDAALDAVPDAAADVPDVAPDAAVDVPDAAPLRCPPFAGPPPAGDGLPDLRLRATLPLGAPPGADGLWAGELDGDGALPEVAIVRGGRLELATADGVERWRSAVLDLQRIVGATDLDGDGRRELVAAGRQVYVFDGLTGAIRWRLPDAPFDGDPPSGIQQARLLDLDGDDLDDLYLTDTGCGDEGSGRGLVWRFAEGFEQPRVSVIDGPRLNGRCTRWQTFADLDGDGRSVVLVTDGDGLNGFDLDGARRWCGRFPAPPNGPLPHIAAEGGWFVFLPEGIAWVEPGADAACDGALAVRWQVELPDPWTAGSVVLADGPTLLVSRFGDDAWRVLRVREGQVQPLIDDARLLGRVDDRFVLAATGDGPTPGRFGALQLFDLAVEPPRAVWPLALPRARPIPMPAGPDRTPEFAGLLALDGQPIVIRGAAEDETADRIERLGLDGVITATWPLTGEPGAIAPLGDGLLLAEAGGSVVALDGRLQPRFLADDGRGPLRAPAGAPRLAALWDGQRARPAAAIAGVVTLLEPDREASPVVWQTVINIPRRGGSPLRPVRRADGTDGLLVRDARAGDAAWAVLDGDTGQRRWRHRLDPAQFRPVGEAMTVAGPNGETVRIARADLVLQPAAWAVDDPTCAETIFADPDPTRAAEECPGFVVKPRVVRGLDPETGACLWRLVLRPAWPCGGPSNQALSTADADGDGQPELYLTETNAVRRIDPLTGALLETIDLGFHETGAVRGGGWLRAAAGVLVRLGGNGPAEAFDGDLQPLWAAPHPEALRLQTWIGRGGALVDGALWMAPATAHPLMAWDLADGAERARWGLADGQVVHDAPFEPRFADIRGVAAAADVNGRGDDGLLLTADDGVLYGLTAQGLAWSRPHDAAIGAPLLATLDADEARALLVPTADGRVLVYGAPGPPAPPVAWDLPCPPSPSCDADDDIDRTEALDRLCAAWIPVRDAARYEVRPLGPNGARIGPWRAVDEPPALLDGLSLVPGVRYAVEVRAVSAVDGRLRRSSGRATDGVEAVNDPPPTVQVVARPAALLPVDGPVVVALVASDDDRLAGWRLDVLDDGRLVRRLAGGPLAAPRFETTVRWNLEDAAKRPVDPGMYQVVATVIDRAGNTARGEAAVEVCDRVCR